MKPGLMKQLRNEDEQQDYLVLTQEAIFGVAEKNYEPKAIENSDQA